MHWSSQNSHSYKQDKAGTFEVGSNGELEFANKCKYRHPTSVAQLHNCILNYRSVMSR